MQSAAAVVLMPLLILFAAYTLTMLFSGPDNFQKLPVPLGGLDPVEHMVPWAHPSDPLKWHRDRFSRCLQGLQTWQTERPTTLLHT